MPSKNTLRGAAAGLFLAGVLLSAFHYFQSETVSQYPDNNEAESLNNNTTPEVPLEEIEKELSALKKENEALIRQIEELESEIAVDDTESAGSARDNAEYNTVLVIEEGMTSAHISSLLQQLNIIESSAAFEQILHEKNAAHRIQVGNYDLNSRMSEETIIDIITS